MATEKVNVIKIDSSDATTSVKNLRAELKQLKDVMLQTEEGTDEYNKALQRSADIQHTLKEQMEEVNASAMDFGQIVGNATNALSGITAGFQAATAVMNLFGIENEDVIKSIQKMQSLMALTQSFASIDNGIKAFRRLGLAIKGAAAGMSTFTKAMISTGIGALVVAVGALAANWDKVTAALRKYGIISKEVEPDIEEQNKKIEEQANKLREAEKALADWNKQQAYKKLSKEDKKIYDENAEALEGLNKQLAENVQQTNAVSNTNKTRWKELRDEGLAIQENIAALEKQNRLLLEDAENSKKRQEAEDNAAKAQEKRTAALDKIRDAYENLKNSIIDYGKTEEQSALDKVTRREEEQLAILDKSLKAGIVSTQEAENQKTLITEQAEKERLEIATKFTNDEKEKKEQAVKEAEENITALYEQEQQKRSLASDAEELQIAEQYQKKEINEQQYNDKIFELGQYRLQNTISLLEQELQEENLSYETRLALEQQLYDAKINFANNATSHSIQKGKEMSEDAKNNFAGVASVAAASFQAIGAIMNDVADNQDKNNKEGFEKSKKLQIAGATMNMLAGITAALAGTYTTHTGWWDWVLAGIQATTIAVTGAMQIAKIRKTKFDDSGASAGASAPSVGAIGAINAPVQFTQDVQGASIQDSIADSRVYVVESDITNTQERVSVAESEARF